MSRCLCEVFRKAEVEMGVKELRGKQETSIRQEAEYEKEE